MNFQNKLEPDKIFQPSLMFVGKAKSQPRVVHLEGEKERKKDMPPYYKTFL
jgi:hypothetical protein